MNKYFLKVYKTLNILCVEDDTDVLEIYRSLFTPIFKNVYFANDGNEGLACFEKEKIDIILTDNMMPHCNGLEMSKKIRELDASVPIILVTALESIEMLREAIELHISSFLKKPFTSRELFTTFNMVAKSVIADRCMMQEQAEKILYSDYQENLTFTKELTIVKNDIEAEKKLFDFDCEVIYRPKDTLSGDSYSIRKIDENSYLIFLVDGMGKGISASVSAMLSSAFVNYYVTQLQKGKKVFSLQKLLLALQEFIGPNLLEYEVLAASFFYLNKKSMQLEYAIFSMPPALYMHMDSDEVFKIKSNNTPFAAYTQNFQLDTLDITKIKKMIIYTDGLNENSVDGSEEMYGHTLAQDFQMTKTLNAFEKKLQERFTQQDDDITYIYISKEEGL